MLDTRQTNNRVGENWRTCERCGNDYPQSKVVIQRGRIICTGPNTNNCMDQYGYQHYYSKLEVPYEEVPVDPPTVDWDDI